MPCDIDRHAAPSANSAGRGLRITVVSAVGCGQTGLSAFDAALWRCGVHLYNLLPLSSVIPPASVVDVRDRFDAPPDEYGHKLYVVRAEARSAEPGAVIAAGLGWLQGDDGRGVFVEHATQARHGDRAEIECALAAEITASLHDLATRRQFAFLPERAGHRIAVTRVEQQPACAIVVAVYQGEGWR